jgi:hypothetical protein
VPTSKQTQLIAYIVAGAYSIALLIAGLQLPQTPARILSVLPAAIVVSFGFFDKTLWRIRPFKLVARKRPRLRGTWRGTLTRFQGPGGAPRTPIPIDLVIRQTYSSLSIVLMSAESRSRSVVASIFFNGDADFTLYYQYQNVPRLDVRNRSAIHYGGAAVEVAGLDPVTLVGEYWTDRDSKGMFEVNFVSRKLAGHFRAALA